MDADHWIGAAVAVAIALAGFIYHWGWVRRTVQDLEARLGDVEKWGGEKTQWAVNEHEKEIAELKIESRRMSDSLIRMTVDINMIAEWVREQKNKHV